MFLDWQQPQRRVLVVFLGLAMVFTGALSWLGWRLLEQDRSLERQRVQEGLELAADHIAVALQRSLAELDGHLQLPAGSSLAGQPGDVVVLRATERGVQVTPPGRLSYYPALDDVREPPASTFAIGEKLEYGAGDPGKAAEIFRTLAQSSNREIRAGALLRLARNLRKAGRTQEALQAYNDLAQLGSVRVAGLPAELVARSALPGLRSVGKGRGPASGSRGDRRQPTQRPLDPPSVRLGVSSGRSAALVGGRAFGSPEEE